MNLNLNNFKLHRATPINAAVKFVKLLEFLAKLKWKYKQSKFGRNDGYEIFIMLIDCEIALKKVPITPGSDA